MRMILTFVFVMQLAKTISAMFISTQPFSAPHVNSMVRISKCAERLCPGEPPMLTVKLSATAAAQKCWLASLLCLKLPHA